MKKNISGLGILASVVILAGCNSGITYGTGVSHEEQTVKGLSKMFALSADDNSKNIDYTSRPDLIMPANKALPSPSAKVENGEDQSWPVSPEERIAAIREEAPEVQRGGELSAEYLSDTNKDGIGKSGTASARKIRSIDRMSSDANFINAIRDDANGVGEGKLARERREEISFSTGVKRKYLTEPPTLYRTPSETAEAGDLGIGAEEIDRVEQEIKTKRRAHKRAAIDADGQ